MNKRGHQEVARLDDVFGVSRDVPVNYVARPDVDGVLVNSLTRDKHIVIYGSSKQGKTCLRKYNLRDDDYILVTCSNTMGLPQVNAAILKAAGFTVEQSSTRTVAGVNKITARISGRLKTPFAELGAEIGSESANVPTTIQEAPLELDPTDVNDIIAALQSIDHTGFIVLEDFHYLSQETQESFSVALKAFHESSPYCFIIVGVWLDQNRLIQYNGDLVGRVEAIDADAWTSGQLMDVIEKGEALLNVRFSPQFKADLVEGCLDSVWIVQEVCHSACTEAEVFSSPEAPVDIVTSSDVRQLTRSIVDRQSARYNAFLSNYSQGFMASQLEIYRWLLYAVLNAEPAALESGLRYADLRHSIDSAHPDSPINPGNLTQALQSTASLQARINIKPIVLDYDASRKRLNVVDRSFLIWLEHQSKDDLLEIIGIG